MSMVTIEVEFDHGTLIASQPHLLPDKGRGLLTILQGSAADPQPGDRGINQKSSGAKVATTSNDRPKVGTVTSAPIRYSPDCFNPLTDEEMGDWGL